MTALAACALVPVTGCGPEVHSGTGACSLDGTVFFDGRSYLPATSVPSLDGRKARMGRLLGLGETGACPGQEPREVQVFEVVGVPVRIAVHTGPAYGPMLHQDGDES